VHVHSECQNQLRREPWRAQERSPGRDSVRRYCKETVAGVYREPNGFHMTVRRLVRGAQDA
jgi:hypothetical protein